MSENFSPTPTLPLPRDTQRQLLAKILKSTGSGGGGGPTTCITGGVGAPVGAVPCAFSIYVQQPGPNFGLWLGDQVLGWSNIVAQGP